MHVTYLYIIYFENIRYKTYTLMYITNNHEILITESGRKYLMSNNLISNVFIHVYIMYNLMLSN